MTLSPRLTYLFDCLARGVVQYKDGETQAFETRADGTKLKWNPDGSGILTVEGTEVLREAGYFKASIEGIVRDEG